MAKFNRPKMPSLPKLPKIKGMDKITAVIGRITDSERFRGTFRVLGWSLGIFFVMISVAWLSLPTGAIAWRVSHEARKAGFLVTVEDVDVSIFGSVTLERVTWDFLPSHSGEGTIPFYAEEVEADIGILRYLLFGTIDADLDFELDEGELSANFVRSDDETTVELHIEDLPLYSVPKVQQMLNAPITGTFELHLEVEAPENKFAESFGYLEIACHGCALGDGETKFYVPGARGMLEKGLTIPRVDLGELAGRFEIKKGVALAEEFASISKDMEIKMGGRIELNDPFKKSRFDLFLKVLFTEKLLQEAPNFQLLVSTASEKAKMDKPDEGWLGFILNGPIEHPRFSGIKSKTDENNLRDKREKRRKEIAKRKKDQAARKKERDAAKKKKRASKTSKAAKTVEPMKLPPPEPAEAPEKDEEPELAEDEEGGDGDGEGGAVEEEEPEEEEEEPEEEAEEPEEEEEEEDPEGDGGDGESEGADEDEELPERS